MKYPVVTQAGKSPKRANAWYEGVV